MRKAQGIYLFSLILLFLSFSAQAQEPMPGDSLQPESLREKPVPLDEPIERPVETAETLSKLDPGKAAFFSAVLPGLGQAYNNSHWKIPIIYLGGAYIVSSVNFYNRNYSENLRNLELISLDPDVTDVNGNDEAFFNRRVSYYRRQRDYTIILGGLLYVLNIVEAYSYAHLQDFDLSDDLAMRLQPALLATPGSAGAGIALTLHIK